MSITRAEWVGDRIEVEGGWTGDISSVRCDLFDDSEDFERVGWWDRTVPAEMSDQSFIQ